MKERRRQGKQKRRGNWLWSHMRCPSDTCSHEIGERILLLLLSLLFTERTTKRFFSVKESEHKTHFLHRKERKMHFIHAKEYLWSKHLITGMSQKHDQSKFNGKKGRINSKQYMYIVSTNKMQHYCSRKEQFLSNCWHIHFLFAFYSWDFFLHETSW